MLVYSYDTIGGSLSLKHTGILSVTDVDRRGAGRLMASTALFKNLIFINIHQAKNTTIESMKDIFALLRCTSKIFSQIWAKIEIFINFAC